MGGSSAARKLVPNRLLGNRSCLVAKCLVIRQASSRRVLPVITENPISAAFGINDKHRTSNIAGLRSIPPGLPLSLRLCTHECRPDRVSRLNLFRPENEADKLTKTARGELQPHPRFWAAFALSGLSQVAMVQAADLSNGYNAALLRLLHRSRFWRILGQRQVRTRVLVVSKIISQNAT